MKPTLCIYHGNCADGFGAAWVVRKAMEANGIPVEFFAGTYGNPPPDVEGQDVLIVDFSYKFPVLKEMCSKANSIVVLDHHKTAEVDLATVSDANFQAIFDMNRSGAMITWDYFNPGQPPPKLLEHIQDRDLWRFALPGTREIQASIFSFPYDFKLWDELMTISPHRLRVEGEAIERKHHKDIAELVKVVTRPMRIGGHVVPMANLPYTLTSDAGHLLAEGHPFAGCYWDTPEGRVFSLRSQENGHDVSVIAAAYGGGGHRNASGFRVPFADLAQFEV